MNDEPTTSQRTQIVAVWTVVAIPLLYGLYHTIKNTLPLFGG